MKQFDVARVLLRFSVLMMSALLAFCAPAAPLKIMPLGDSITMGYGVGGGFRTKLFSNLVNNGYSFLFVGSNPENPSPALTAADQHFHEGHGGFKINEISANLVGGGNWLAVDPDLILLLIGTNDYGQDYDTPNALNRLDELLTIIATNRPNAVVIVANILLRTDAPSVDAKIQSEFNANLPSRIAAHAALGRQIFFYNLRSWIDAFDLLDGLHPSKNGYNKLGDGWFTAINQIYNLDTNGPTLVKAESGIRLTNVTVTFNEPVSDNSAVPGNFALSGGASVFNAKLNTNGNREMLLRTSVLAPGSNYVLTVNNVTDRSTNHNVIKPNSSTNFVTPVPVSGVFSNIAEAANLTLLYSLDLPASANFNSTGVTYAVNQSASLANGFTRVAYYLELQKPNGQLDYVYVSMDPFTTLAGRLGVPTTASGAFFQQSVSNLHVFSTLSDVVTGTNLSGRLEFWPSSYGPQNSAGVPGASSVLYDWGDGGASTSAGHGSMQILNPAASQVLIAYNGWGTGATSDVGLGNRPTSDPDWTFAANASQYALKRLQVLVQPALAAVVHVPFNENAGTTTTNRGSAGGVFTLTTPLPSWTTEVPPDAGGASALDFGLSSGNVAVDSPAPIAALGGLGAFTITGWLNNRSIVQGSGGNVIATWFDGTTSGVEVVYKSDGSLIFSVNDVPSSSAPRSSAGKIPEEFEINPANWRYFAVTYDSAMGKGAFYFGSPAQDATLDVIRDYPGQGPTAPATARFSVGSLNPERRPFSQNRVFRGFIDDVRVFKQVLTLPEIVSVQHGAAGNSLPEPTNITRHLTITSTNPVTGALINVSPADTNSASGGPTPLDRYYADNTVVTLTAPSMAGGNLFSKWQRDGTDLTTNPVAMVTMDADHTLLAVFVTPPPPRTLTVSSVNPTNGVLVTVTPADNAMQTDGTTTFTRVFSNNVSVTLTAPAAAGVNSFQKWQRDGVDFSTNRNLTITVDADRTFTAVYVSPPPPRTITIASVNPTNGVLVGVSPLDVNMQGDGTTSFARAFSNNTSVTLTAPAVTGANGFQKWQRDGTDFSTNRIITFAVDANRAFTAIYTSPPPPRVLTVASVNPTNGVLVGVSPPDVNMQADGSTSFTRVFSNSVSVTLTAPAITGVNGFQKWQRDGTDFSTNRIITFAVDVDRAFTAIYTSPPPPRVLTVASVNPTNGVLVGVSPLDVNMQGDGTTSFTRSFSNNVSVTLTAPAITGTNGFQKWRRDGTDFSTNRIITFAVDVDRAFTAIYTSPPPPRVLTVASVNPTSGVAIAVAPADNMSLAGGVTTFLRTYSNGVSVTLTAPAGVGSNTFTKWQRDGVDFTTNLAAVVTMDAARTLTAVYASPPPPLFPLVRLVFDEASGTNTANLGSAGGTFGLTQNSPVRTMVVPPGVGGSNALDFGTSSGSYAVDSAAPLPALAGLTKFTLTGWLNNRSVVQGSGGNRVLSCIDNGGDGFEVVYKGDGSLILSVNQNPDSASARSSSGRIPEDYFASVANWRFFAITYDSGTGNVEFFFGSGTADATSDGTRSYPDRGPVGAGTGRLTIGHMNPATRSAYLSRVFRGVVDDVQIFDRVLPPSDIVLVQRTAPSGVPPTPPVAAFTGTPLTGLAPLNVSFTDSSTGTITNRTWDFGDGSGTNVAGTSVGHVFATAGNYTVMLRVIGPGGTNTLTRTSYVTVTNAQPPAAAFTASPTSGGRPLPVTFTDTSTGTITNRVWDFGDGTGTNTPATSVPHTYTAAGTYSVMLTAQGPGGASTTTQNSLITVTNPPSPVANFMASPTSGSRPLPVTFTDTSTGSITNRVWDFGDGTGTNTSATSVPHTYAAVGTYSVTLIAQGPGGASTVTQNNLITVTNPPTPVAHFTASPNIGSRPLPVTFTDTSTGSITNRIWDFGDGTGTNTLATSVPHTYTAAGSYTVGLTVQGPGGTHSLILSPTVLVTNPPPPVANFTGSPLQGATPLTVTFLDSSTGGITNRQWTFGDSTGTNTTVTNCAHVYSATGTFTVTLTVNGPGGSDTQVRAGYVTVTNSSGIMPVVKLPLNEGTGLATANLGSAGGVFSLTPNTPTWTAGGAPGVGGASAIDFSFYSGDFAVDSPAIIPALAGLTQFTITGWLNNRSSIQGSGGNRVVTWATAAGDGVDLVYRSDGSLDLGVNRLADGTARSSSGRIPVDANAGAANWRFFAVTYDAGAQQVRYYFGAAGSSAALDVLKSYAQGPVSASIGRMTVGHSGPTVRPTMLNRVFRGLIDEIQIFDRALTLTQITALQGGSPPPPSPAPRFIPTLRPRIVATEWQAGGAMALRVSGTAGRHYAVLAGDDFLNWTAVGEGDADETGAFQFIDTKASEFRVRFYQVVEPY